MSRPALVISNKAPGSLRCPGCGATMTLFGIERDPTSARAELRTYVCRRCDALQTETMPVARVKATPYRRTVMDVFAANGAFDPETTRLLCSTFDAAWKAANASKGTVAGKDEVADRRELLAKHMIAIRRGERNPNRLVEKALRHLGASS